MDLLFSHLQEAVAGRFSLERELGRGGMGVVYLARDVALDRPVAIKLLPPEFGEGRDRFLREARTAAGLSHPNIVPIHLVEERGDLVFFVMAFIEGETLGERVRRQGPLPVAEASRIIREVAWALAYAHGRGIIHRDIKPDNILLELGSGRAMVTDFGIARVVSRSTVSQQGEIVGTIQYMSPEQADPDAVVDGRADLYSLGATAFYALTGRLPFEATSAVALLAMHLSEPAPPVTSVRAELPPRLAEAVDRCLAKDPAARMPSADALAEALGEVAMTKAIPPSILALREATGAAGLLVGLPAMIVLWVRMLAPESLSVGIYFAAALAGVGALQFLITVRGVVRSGHSAKDVGDVARSVFTATQEDRSAVVSREQLKTLMRNLKNPLWRIAIAAVAAVHFGVGLNAAAVLVKLGDLSKIPEILMLMGFGGLLGAFALQVGPFRTGNDVQSRIKRWLVRMAGTFWDNPVMRGIFRFAGVGAAPPRSAPTVERAATELLLGKAADGLFEALPKDQRQRLADVPEVIRKLERVAQSLRGRRDDLAKAIGEAGQMGGARRDQVVGELEEAKNLAAAALAAAVSALENLRLDLLRLRAGVGSADDLTGSLEEARRVGEQVDAELEVRVPLQNPGGEGHGPRAAS
jgi:serine/threonine-protein kinase